MLSVLEVVFRRDPVAGACGIARELQITLIDMRGGSADLHIRTVAFKHSVRMLMAVIVSVALMMVPAAGFAAATALTLHLIVGHAVPFS